MKTSLLCVLPASLWLLAGCGNVCDRGADAPERLAARSGDCELGETFARPTEAQRKEARDACEEDLAACNDKDVERLNAYYDCLERVPECVAGQEASFLGGVSGCATTLMQLSAACVEARQSR